MPKSKGKVLGKVRELVITPQQYAQLLEYTTGTGGRQDLCKRVHDSVVTRGTILVARVYEADMERIIALVTRADSGGWQALFRDIMNANTT